MQLICICFHGQSFKLYYKVGYVLFFLFECFDFLFGICCLYLVTEYCLDLSYEIVSILGSCFFVQLIKLLLGIYACYGSSKMGKDHCNPVIGLYDPVTSEEQPYPSPPVFKFHLFPSNYSESKTMLLGTLACMFLFACAGALDILFV